MHSKILTSIFVLHLACLHALTTESVAGLSLAGKDHSLSSPEIKGIVLLGSRKKVFDKSQSRNVEGVEWAGLEIPGDPSLLCQKLTDFLKKPLTLETIGEIKRTITDYYMRERHPFVIVEIPEQEITSGVLQMVIVESKLGKLVVEDKEGAFNKQIKSYFQIEPGDPIDESRLIQDVSFVNRNPFRRSNLVFGPGELKDTTDVIISTKSRRPLRFYAGTDDTGIELVGPNRWYTGFNWANAFGLDHIFSYQYSTSYNIHLFQAHTAEYTALLPWEHVLKIYGGYSEVHPQVQAPIAKNNGWSMQMSGRYLVPLKIYPHLEHEITAGFDFKRSNNTFIFTEDFPVFGNNVNLTQILLEYSGNYETNSYRLDFTSQIFWSPGRWIADQKNENFASLRPGAVNQWVYFHGYFVYLQKLPKSFSLSLRAEGQAASQPLLPSEQFGLGGYNTVRGYEEREVNKDNALLLNLELRSPAFPVIYLDGLQFLAFFDYGWGINIDTVPGSQKADFLMGAGPGVRYTLEPYFTSRVDWGVRLHNKVDFPGGWNRFHFNFTLSY